MSDALTREVIIDRSPWWEAAIAGRRTPILADDPQPGYYKRRLVRGGIFVPARIWQVETRCIETGDLVADVQLLCEVSTGPADPYEQWPYLGKHPVPEADFRYRVAVGEWATAHSPEAPEANPRKAVNLNKTQPVF